jgi:hypothetical protein
MIQTHVLDTTKPSNGDYVAPNHAAGEKWPGDQRPTEQLTLFDKRLTSPAIPSRPKRTPVVVDEGEESEDTDWFGPNS